MSKIKVADKHINHLNKIKVEKNLKSVSQALYHLVQSDIDKGKK